MKANVANQNSNWMFPISGTIGFGSILLLLLALFVSGCDNNPKPAQTRPYTVVEIIDMLPQLSEVKDTVIYTSRCGKKSYAWDDCETGERNHGTHDTCVPNEPIRVRLAGKTFDPHHFLDSLLIQHARAGGVYQGNVRVGYTPLPTSAVAHRNKWGNWELVFYDILPWILLFAGVLLLLLIAWRPSTTSRTQTTARHEETNIVHNVESRSATPLATSGLAPGEIRIQWMPGMQVNINGDPQHAQR